MNPKHADLDERFWLRARPNHEPFIDGASFLEKFFTGAGQ